MTIHIIFFFENSKGAPRAYCPPVYVDGVADNYNPVPGTAVPEQAINGQIVDYAKCIYVVIGQWISYVDAKNTCRKFFKGF